MARYDPNTSVREALATFVDNPLYTEATGAIRINSMDRKRFGILYLYRGKVYAVQVKGYPLRFYTRLLASGLSEENTQELTRKYGRDNENTDIIDYAMKKMMIDADEAWTFVREHTMSAWDDLFAWHGVKVEWKDGMQTEVLTFRNHPVSLEKLIELGENRASYLEEIADRYTVKPEDLADLKYRMADHDPVKPGLEQILQAYGNGDYAVSDLVRLTGMPPFNLVGAVYALWLQNRVAVWYEGFPITHQNVEEMRTNPTTYGEAQPLVGSEMSLTPKNTEPDPQIDLPLEETFEPEVDEELNNVVLPQREELSTEPTPTYDMEHETMTKTAYDADDEGAIPLDDGSAGEQSEVVVKAVTSPKVQQVAIHAAPLAVPASDFANSFAAFITQARTQLETLRAEMADSAQQMTACDDLLQATRSDIASHQEAIRQAEASISETQATRDAWEGVYDGAETQYKSIQQHLNSLREIG